MNKYFIQIDWQSWTKHGDNNEGSNIIFGDTLKEAAEKTREYISETCPDNGGIDWEIKVAIYDKSIESTAFFSEGVNDMVGKVIDNLHVNNKQFDELWEQFSDN